MATDRNEMQKLNENLEIREKNEQMGIAEALKRYGFVFLEPPFKTLDELLDSYISSDNDNLPPPVAARELQPLPPAQLDPLQREAMINEHMIRQRALMDRYRQQKAQEERLEREQAQMGRLQPQMSAPPPLNQQPHRRNKLP